MQICTLLISPTNIRDQSAAAPLLPGSTWVDDARVPGCRGRRSRGAGVVLVYCGAARRVTKLTNDLLILQALMAESVVHYNVVMNLGDNNISNKIQLSSTFKRELFGPTDYKIWCCLMSFNLLFFLLAQD